MSCVPRPEQDEQTWRVVKLRMPAGCGPVVQERLACLSYRQATLVAGSLSLVFALLIFIHEMALEGGFNLRNYVAVAFCVVWLIVTALLVLAVYKRAHFLLLPWMILTCMLTPLFVVGIVAGCRMIGVCLRHGLPKSCIHEYHIFGTIDHTVAATKLALLFIMLIANSGCILVVYRYFMILSANDARKRKQDSMLHTGDTPTSVRYENFQDDGDSETQVPLCDNSEVTEDNATRSLVT